ncbi:hypothetical protein [Streptomyces sp. NPDC056937]|uniref:hypothetical protein n=1 Tax=Streptomyces sp. NPDC056937 TaxID=3345969 RepID=UPI003637D720
MSHLRTLAAHDPEQAYRVVADLVLVMVCEVPEATGAMNNPLVSLREYGRAHTLLNDAGILVKQATALLLGLPAASPAAEQEMTDLALAEPDADWAQNALPAPRSCEDDVWARAVEEFRQRVPHRWA